MAPAFAGHGWLRLLLSAAGSAGAVVVLSNFASQRRRTARAEISRRASGRIQEQQLAEARSVFDLPGAGIEPWLADAWVVGVVGLAALLLGMSGEAISRPLGFVGVVLTSALALRLAGVGSDHIRVELTRGAWWVQANEGGRVIRRSGFGVLKPELLADALVLWSNDGRVGVLRGELEPEERAWLAQRLSALQGDDCSMPEEARRQIEQSEASHHG